MSEERLLTREGGFVTTVQTPPFQIPADVIVWGERFFVRDPAGEYREGMAYAVPVPAVEADADAPE